MLAGLMLLLPTAVFQQKSSFRASAALRECHAVFHSSVRAKWNSQSWSCKSADDDEVGRGESGMDGAGQVLPGFGVEGLGWSGTLIS